MSSSENSKFCSGDILEPMTHNPISRTTLALFAGASGDHNPIHIDIDFAKSVGMDDVFAHGMLGMAYLGRFLTSITDQRNIRSYNVRFSSITQVGAELKCTGKVKEITDNNSERLMKIELLVTDQNNDVKLVGDAVIAL
ncbi:MAG: MaoC family dehydratase [Proteobacteria bacterium]|nr:MaoC family dehydratase [SAR86 cluster bacterium]MDA0345291.1 MaoC family dehydratase [Pseudomonadota bacterium]MDA0900237.1 MaoC family dehydratase [Pseudomonadota bacterium]